MPKKFDKQLTKLGKTIVNRVKQRERLQAMSARIDAKIEKWNFLSEEIESLTEERAAFAKKHRLPLVNADGDSY
jgi:hypothetical protein